MTGDKSLANTASADTEITLALLREVESDSGVTQRLVAKNLGIALGLANSYLKRCARKGLIKVSQAPANRYAYYLTPKGFAEKSRLTAEYLSTSLNFFREARNECSELFDHCAQQGWTRTVLCGKSEMVEIATLCVSNSQVELVAVIDENEPDGIFSGIPLYQDLTSVEGIEAAVITDLTNPQATFDRLLEYLPPERILAPRFSHISRQLPNLVE